MLMEPVFLVAKNVWSLNIHLDKQVFVKVAALMPLAWKIVPSLVVKLLVKPVALIFSRAVTILMTAKSAVWYPAGNSRAATTHVRECQVADILELIRFVWMMVPANSKILTMTVMLLFKLDVGSSTEIFKEPTRTQTRLEPYLIQSTVKKNVLQFMGGCCQICLPIASLVVTTLKWQMISLLPKLRKGYENTLSIDYAA